jgi:adenylate cyclase
LPEKSGLLFALAEAMPVQFTVLEEKFVGRTLHAGKLVSISESEAGLDSELKPAPLSNLKLELESVSGTAPAGEIYAKVVEAIAGSSNQMRIHFTSVSPELKAWVQQFVGRQPAEADKT